MNSIGMASRPGSSTSTRSSLSTKQTLREAAGITRGKLVIVEDHHPEGGLGAAVMEALAADMTPPRIVHLAVRHLPGSGKPQELLDRAEISARHIVAAARRLYEQ